MPKFKIFFAENEELRTQPITQRLRVLINDRSHNLSMEVTCLETSAVQEMIVHSYADSKFVSGECYYRFLLLQNDANLYS